MPISDAFEDSLVAGLEPEPHEKFDLGERFWLLKPFYSNEYAEEVLERFNSHAEEWQRSAVGQTVWQAYQLYHNLESGTPGVSSPAVTIGSAGESGEFLSMSINHFRGLLKHQLALVTSDRPAWDPQARTTDADAVRQVQLVRQLLDYELTAKRFDQKVYDQLELAAVCASGFMALGWDANAGINGEGDVWGIVLAPWEIKHEKVRSYSDATWWIFRTFESRWEWAAHFAEADPEKARKIADIDAKDEAFSSYFLDRADDDSDDADRIAVLNVYAKPTKACPNGRLSKVTSGNVVLLDGPMPYGADVPITRICPAEFLGTSTPYADAWSLISSQEAYNAVMSAIMTRVDAHGVPNVVAPEGSEIEPADLGGANFIKYPGGMEKPGLLDMLQIPPALPSVAQMVKSGMEELSGINSVTRGNPAENISSGSMAALLQTMAIQFNSPMERTYAFNLEAVGTFIVRIFQRMATREQLISIAGSDSQWATETFQAEDIKDVLRVAVKSAAALSKTTAGRKEIADQLLQRNMIQDPREYMQVVATGEMDSLFSGPVNELSHIKSENERILTGTKPSALAFDNHELHIREHKSLLDTKVRDRPELLQAAIGHLQEHMAIWTQLSQQSPDILAAIGCPPLPGAMAMGQQAAQMSGMAPAPSQPGPATQATPHAEDQQKKPGPPPEPPGQEQGAEPRMPTPAKDPMTGESPVGA